MHSLLTRQIESYLGAIFIFLLAAFFVGLMFIGMKNFDSELSVIYSDQAQTRIVK